MNNYAIEVAARIIYALSWSGLPQHVKDRCLENTRQVFLATWPILTESLREMHQPWNLGDRVVCSHCNDHTEPVRKSTYPCPTIQELDKIEESL